MVEQYIKSNMCVLPWTHLEVDVNGSASPCCLYKGTIDSYKVYDTDLSTIQNSDYMERLREQFRCGERPAGCANCWMEEDAGKTSKRQNSIYKMKNSLQGWTPAAKPKLQFLDFKLGNVCNLKCRICGSWSSSKWAQEELDYGPNPLARQQLHDGGWPKRNPEFFEDIKNIIPDVEYFEFTGGEPFMIREHFRMLEHCIETGSCHRQDIHYNTNGTQLPDLRTFWMWRQFKRVEIAFSIDDVGARFEYQRHPARWDEVNANIREFQFLGSGIDYQICSTINIFNILSLGELLDWVRSINPRFFYVNTCFDPPYYNIQTLPTSVKKLATERYRDLPEFQSIINFMNSADRYSEEINNRRRERILLADQYRGENFAQTFPVLNSLLKIYD